MSSFDLNLYPTLNRMAQSPARIKFVIGPAGSAKTSFLVMEMFRRACMQYPDAGGVRRTRTLIGRNTYQILKSATIPTVENMLGWLGEALTCEAIATAG